MMKENFVPGKKFYDRVQWCLKDKLKMDCLVTWTPDGKIMFIKIIYDKKKNSKIILKGMVR